MTFCRGIPQVTLRWRALYQAAQTISRLARGRTAVRPYTRNLGQSVERKLGRSESGRYNRGVLLCREANWRSAR